MPVRGSPNIMSAEQLPELLFSPSIILFTAKSRKQRGGVKRLKVRLFCEKKHI